MFLFLKYFCSIKYVLYFLLGNSPASEFYMPMFWNTLFHLHSWIGILHTYLPMKMGQTECSQTLAYKIQMLENYPEESIPHSEHSESFKSRKYVLLAFFVFSCKSIWLLLSSLSTGCVTGKGCF
jgi:hypothetical protein